MSIAAMKQQRAQVLDKAKAITAKAKAENRELTEAEGTSVEAFLAEAKEMQGKIEAAERRNALMAEVDTQAAGNLPDANAPPVPRTSAGAGQPGALPAQPRAEDTANRGFRTPREFFSAVMRAGQSQGRNLDARLRPLATAGSDEGGEYSDPYGGFLIPAAFSPNMLNVAAEMDPTAGLTTAIPMGSPIVRIPARTDKTHTSSVSGGLRFYRRAEADTVTASRMQMEMIELKANGLMGLSFQTEELLRDSPISVAALLEAGFRDEYGAVMLNEKLFGTGAGEFLGVMNSPCLVSVAKETGQAAATIVLANILKMRARCWGYSQAIWLANHDCYPQLAQLQMAVGTGGVPVYQPSLLDDRPDRLLGRPIAYTEFAKTCGTTGDLILGNYSQFLEGTLQGLESAESVHVRFSNNERAFRVTVRNDGQPWWRTALTPKQGTNTLSPFVALAAR